MADPAFSRVAFSARCVRGHGGDGFFYGVAFSADFVISYDVPCVVKVHYRANVEDRAHGGRRAGHAAAPPVVFQVCGVELMVNKLSVV